MKDMKKEMPVASEPMQEEKPKSGVFPMNKKAVKKGISSIDQLRDLAKKIKPKQMG